MTLSQLGPDLVAGSIGQPPEFTVSQALAVLNQVLDTATPTMTVVGEVANHKINQGKWVFFDLKDQTGLLNCFIPVYQLRVAIEDGMKVVVQARPGLTKWGRFSLTIQSIHPVGEGSIKKSFELLRKKLTLEGLFDQSRKQVLPSQPQHIGIISSVDAAGYRDFIKIISARMSGLDIDVISTQVQGNGAADQIIAAVQQFNEQADLPEVIAILRGGGSRDDLAVFDDEKLVRAVAASRIPILAGIGHEIDTTLVDLVADQRASTPSNAAELVVRDKRELVNSVDEQLNHIVQSLTSRVDNQKLHLYDDLSQMSRLMEKRLDGAELRASLLGQTLLAYDPRAALKRGYALVWDEGHRLPVDIQMGDQLTIETYKKLIKAEVKYVQAK